MYAPIMIDEQEYYLRPMNCPHHHMIYAHDQWSYRDLPVRLSLPDMENLDKYVDDSEGWKTALSILKQAMDESGYPYKEVEGEAAFYGPKVDFMVKSVVGTEYAISTNQLDFMATKRFNLVYTAEDGSKQPVYVIHRAPMGSHERFAAFLIEHYAGKFPTWLSPTQAVVIPIADRHEEYAQKVRDLLFFSEVDSVNTGIRTETDFASERMQKKIRNAQHRQIP